LEYPALHEEQSQRNLGQVADSGVSEITPDALTPDILKAIDIVMGSHVGRASAVKFAALKYQVNRLIYPAVIGERSLREMMEVERPNILFCTTAPGGHFLPSEDPAIRNKEVTGCIRSVEGYLIGAAKRKSAILKAYPGAVQMELGI